MRMGFPSSLAFRGTRNLVPLTTSRRGTVADRYFGPLRLRNGASVKLRK